MSHSDTYNFVAGDEELDLHELFRFDSAFDDTVANNLSLTVADRPAGLPFASPFLRPFEGVQGRPDSWLSPPAETANFLDVVNFDDFIAPDGSSQNPPVSTSASIFSAPLNVTDTVTPPEHIVAAPEDVSSIPAAKKLEAAESEIEQLKVALAVGSSQYKLSTTAASCQSTSNLRKRKSSNSEGSLAKKHTMMTMGPIEAMWSPGISEGERRVFQENYASPATPSPFQGQGQGQGHLDSSPQALNVYISSPDGFEISPEDLRSMQQFLRNNTSFVHSTSPQMSTSISASDSTMTPHSVNTKVKRAPLQRSPRSMPKSTTRTISKVMNKVKATPKKTQHKHTNSATLTASPSPAVSIQHRSMDELLALNFYSLTEQEKCRVLLPMLRGLNPKELEASLAELPCIQAKGPGHEVHVARAIRNSPPMPEADAALSIKLTAGTLSSPTPISKPSYSPTPVPQALLVPQKVSVSVEAGENLGAMRQRKALEKAALLQAQGRKR